MLEWFGPLDKGYVVLDKILSLMSKPYFHGFLSSSKAEKILSSTKKKGTYLVRFSSTEPGAFTVSAVSKEDKVQHVRIAHKPGGGYILGGIEFSSLDDLVNSKHHKQMKPRLNLLQPCTPTPFANLVTNKERASSGYLL